MRTTFITLAQTDGTRRGILEAVTHAGRGDVFAGYSRWPWPALCDEVSKLRITRRRLADVVSIRFAVGENRDKERDSEGRWLAIPLVSCVIETSPGGVEPP